MRFFIALEIPEENKAELEQLEAKLSQVIPNFRPTDSGKLHLTFAFIGEQPENWKEPLGEVIKKAALDIKPFEITPAYLDGFPNLHHANILWVGIKGDIDRLYILRERIKDGLNLLGLPYDERRYIPHIALGKVNNLNLTPNQEKEFEKIDFANLSSIKVNAVKLFESIPNHGFHKHNTLAQAKLI